MVPAKMKIKLSPKGIRLVDCDFQAVPKAAIVSSNEIIFKGTIKAGKRKKWLLIQLKKTSGSTAFQNLTTTKAMNKNAPENRLSETTDRRLRIRARLFMDFILQPSVYTRGMMAYNRLRWGSDKVTRMLILPSLSNQGRMVNSLAPFLCMGSA